ncbi:antiviral reverse transcriptase Drt3a [Lonsdalea quercina]|uniref:antiviral reverse transcriptase Drt3a n=1 Tax=Lonsdalea quercina TaxID=71657 RepID=UPI00397680BA
MLNQSFTTPNLLKLLRKNEPRKFRMGRSREEYLNFIQTNLNRINPQQHSFTSISKAKINGKEVIMASDLIEMLLLRKCNDNIKRIFGLKKTDRQDIIKKNNIMLSESIPYYIYRLDIKSFYEYVDKYKILEKINNNSIVSFTTKKIIRNFFNQTMFANKKGLPRGIGLSSTLSDLYLEEFDNTIKRTHQVYYHSRYVDDIIIFSFERIHDYLNFFQKKLPTPLLLNKEKCNEYIIDNNVNKTHVLEFLGYKFIIPNKPSEKSRKIQIEISESKIKKIKKRIVLSLKDYCNNGNKELLEKRMKYLTRNVPIKTDQKGKKTLYSGIYYTFVHITKYEQLISLDAFKNYLIHSPKGELGKKLSRHRKSDYQCIKKYSFRFGYDKKLKFNLTLNELKEITRIW